MKNRNDIKSYKKKLKELDLLSNSYEKGLISSSEYSKFLIKTIEEVKSNTVEDFEIDIKEGLKEIKLLKKIQNKIQKNLKLDDNEIKYILCNI